MPPNSAFDFNFTEPRTLDRSTDGIDFGTRNAENLLPLPATATLQPQAGIRGTGLPPGSQPPVGVEPSPPPVAPPSPPPVDPSVPAQIGAAPQDLDSLTSAFRQEFAGDDRDRSRSNLAIPENAQRAFDQFRGIVNAAGGDFDAILGEIGGTRMLDRIREFLGRDVGEQSGIIQIGNGQTLTAPGVDPNSPSSLDLMAGAGGSAGSGGPVRATQSPSGSTVTPSVVTPGGGGGGGGGGGTGNTGTTLPPVPTVDLSSPAAGGPSFPNQFPNAGEDELSRIINERLGGLTATGGITDLTAVPRPTEGVGILSRLAQGGAGGTSTTGTVDGIPRFDSELFQAGSQGLQGQISDGGLDPSLLANVQRSLGEHLDINREQALERYDEELSRRRLGGAGIEREDIRRLDRDLTQEMNRNLRDVATQMGLSAADRQLAASNAAASIGQNEDVQRLRFMSEREARQLAAATGLSDAEIQQRGQDIAMLQTQLSTSLSAAGLATERALGIGKLGLENLATNLAFMESAFDQRMQTAQFVEAANQARSGNVSSMITLMLQFANALQQGAVAP